MISVSSDQGTGDDQLLSSIASVSMQVTSQNVLAVRDTLLDKAADLDAGLKLYWKSATTMPQLAGDPVSADASVAFPEKTHALLTYCQKYVDQLRDAAHALDATARSYGLTEADIADTMHAVGFAADAAAGGSSGGPTVEPASPAGQGSSIDQILNPHLYGGK